ncbi:ABI gene family member 3 [Fukomys damarensis]|uniref:ABI gene family member 3 n=1 Tax=Fukomys damarensis TaxID=885580 RepID=A0A091DS14_FUKDA|nr:ABI gene family member 3 [Fukomys damarensis]
MAVATDKRKALEETMAFTTQALASVAYQVGNLAGHTLSMLDLQGTALRQVEARVSSLGQMVNMHLEKVARREIGTLAAVQRLYPGQKVLAPESLPPLTPYCRRPINFGCLDHVGHGVKIACACAGGGRRRLTLRLPAVVTLYPYTRRKDSELSFAEGTVICVTRRLSDGWCEGVSAEGAGLFPGNYVEPSC